VKPALVAALSCALALLAQRALAGYLAGHDVIGELLVHQKLSVAALLAALLGLRLFLHLVAPGWLLWLLVTRVLRDANRR
jgi:hypothetical protein